MVTDEQVRWIALFFLFSLMDEKVALQAAHKSIAHLKATTSASLDPASSEAKVILIRTMLKDLEQYRKVISRQKITPVTEATWSLPDQFDLTAWAKFQKDASESEVVAVVLSRILGVSDSELAEGLGVTMGTARYRVGKGIRHLGSHLRVRT